MDYYERQERKHLAASKIIAWLWAALILMVVTDLHAQTITFTAETTTGIETVTPVLTWDTTPLADNCVASGDWSGSKGGAGNETLAPITSGATYNLECSWSGGSVTLTWTAPTENTDGTPLTDLEGFFIYYGTTDGGPYPNREKIVSKAATSWVIDDLADGGWYFVATAYNARNVESELSGQATKTVGAASDTRSVGITVNPRPSSPTGLSAN